ncbi:cyclo(L-tyrosyl-L-tyrosyl) synthase [Streptomyces sp. BK208]|uniref:tRNA-dependent cyclodipeptide synthase n=1 Tax=Streptomyces sp. BK208 TaxID=2512150 RepID=UPI0010E393EC|nr:tRNA-dependent cyclodipeptide synthase [Streptomyces sp. BK208]TDT39964.1 cyclo(L-tyrosyl-L-tyrosyl) synthase [Streptomyces sp. BK208]
MPHIDTEPLTERCGHIYRQRHHALFGMSPGNSYFSRSKIRQILQWAFDEFDSVHAYLPEQGTYFTFRAIGYGETDAHRKARKEVRALRNRIRHALDDLGVHEADSYIVDLGTLQENAQYAHLRTRTHEAFRNDQKFREACLQNARDFLAGRELRGSTSDRARQCMAARYLLTKLPTYIDTPSLVGAPSSVRCYHRPTDFDRAFFNRSFSLRPTGNQGFVRVYAQ